MNKRSWYWFQREQRLTWIIQTCFCAQLVPVKRWNTRKQLFHNICKICAEAVCNSKGICGCFSIYCDRLNRILQFLFCNFFFACSRIQIYMEKTFSVLCVEIMETYFSDIVKSPGKNCALLGHLPFNPRFCNFQSVHQMEWTISVWSNRNIQDQLWRWSTLMVWSFRSVGPKCSFPFDKIVVASTTLLYRACKNNNQMHSGLGWV